MTVAELEERMGSGELTEWLTYYKKNPFGQFREDWRTGILAAMVMNRYRKKGTEPFAPTDFLWGAGDKRRNRTTEKVLAALDILAKK